MLAKHITIGMVVRIDTGDRYSLSAGRVVRRDSPRRWTILFDGEEYSRPAGKIWPAHGTAPGGWESCGANIIHPSPIPGVRINRRRMIENQTGSNTRGISERLGRLHVSETPMAAVRAVYAQCGKKSLRWAPPAFRRGVVHTILATHASNRAEYRAVMGHGPLPTEAQITAAMLACR